MQARIDVHELVDLRQALGALRHEGTLAAHGRTGEPGVAGLFRKARAELEAVLGVRGLVAGAFLDLLEQGGIGRDRKDGDAVESRLEGEVGEHDRTVEHLGGRASKQLRLVLGENLSRVLDPTLHPLLAFGGRGLEYGRDVLGRDGLAVERVHVHQFRGDEMDGARGTGRSAHETSFAMVVVGIGLLHRMGFGLGIKVDARNQVEGLGEHVEDRFRLPIRNLVADGMMGARHHAMQAVDALRGQGDGHEVLIGPIARAGVAALDMRTLIGEILVVLQLDQMIAQHLVGRFVDG